MRGDELTALGHLSGSALAQFGGLAKGVHRAASQRIFGALGPIGVPVRLMHDGISTASYGAVEASLKGLPRVAGTALGRAVPAHAERMADSPVGGMALAALNGMWGDAIAREAAGVALGLTVRRRGREVELDSSGLANAYPHATPRIAVFVHGLCGDEQGWGLTRRPSYGAQLREQHGYTPVYVRYNTGLHISDNGRRLAEVLDHVVAGWPVDVTEIVLVGHSMGGLVARSACHYGEKDGRGWVGPVRHVFCLGTPHLGAPLERAANRAGHALGRLAETRPFANLVNARSAGIKDLRFGSCIEADWCDCDPDEYLRDRCNEVPFLPEANYYFIGATLTRKPEGRVGDLLVQYVSASGDGPKRRIPFEADNGRHLGGINHFQLLNHPAVYEQMSEWITRPPAAPSRVPSRARLQA
jgi:pimeloyl-ACP methyl ester carboxylesterase